MDVDD
jgi:hypothetical protein